MNHAENHTLKKLRAGKLVGSQRLDLSCGLSEFPPEIFDLADTLEILNLSDNTLSSLPDDLVKLSKLKVIFCSNNQFEHVPEILGLCESLSMVGFKANKIKIISAKALPKKLQWLILTDNQITHLPAEIGQCTHLQKLMLAGNQLCSLPNEMAACSALELLRISANQLSALPEWLLTMPKLAWLAFAGNPFCREIETERTNFNTATRIAWQDLQLQQVLGQGASGVIYQADLLQDLLQNTAKKTVAVKLFKGEVTSDGLPQNELAASLHAGAHANLTHILGAIHQHPEHAQGLVMSLIDPNFNTLANPPSLASCTRDVYRDNTRFSLKNVINIALSIAHAMQHLHKNGISHGDLYAHNILHNELGECLLSDFGAAAFLPNDATALNLQGLEVRAFACLLEELLAHCEIKNTAQLSALQALQHDCTQSMVENRPLFAEIVQKLEAL